MEHSNKLVFTLSYHFYSAGNPANHFDLFFDLDEFSYLEQFSLLTADFLAVFSEKLERDWWQNRNLDVLKWRRGRPHRREYLTFSGKLSQNRGRVRVLFQGPVLNLEPDWAKKKILKAGELRVSVKVFQAELTPGQSKRASFGLILL